MASELVSCPECKRKLRVPTELIGKHVKCPTCGHNFTADPATQAPPPPPAAVEEKPTRTSKVSRDEKEDDDEDEDRPRRKRLRSRRDDDEDEDRPRRRRSRSSHDDDEDDEDDDRRRRRRDFIPHRGGAVLTMGILGLALTVFPMVPLAGLVLAIIGWVMGNADLAEMRAGRMDPEGEGQTNAGRICGIVAVVLHVLGILLLFAYFFCMCAGLGAMGAAGGRH